MCIDYEIFTQILLCVAPRGAAVDDGRGVYAPEGPNSRIKVRMQKKQKAG